MRFFIYFSVALTVSMCELHAGNVALVIGNQEYSSVSPLSNPTNDSREVSKALAQQGFKVTRADNLTRDALLNTLRSFRERADGADVALIYYAGHGIEIAGTNYLVPIDAHLADERDATIEMIGIDTLIYQISGAKALKMIVLDACRNNPFISTMKRVDGSRSIHRGLVDVHTTQSDTLIAYAAAAGEITPDGVAGENSPFTSAFLKALSGPPLDVRRLLGVVRDEMQVATPDAAPYVYSSLGGGAYVINPKSIPPIKDAASRAEENLLDGFVNADTEGTLAAWDAFIRGNGEQKEHPLVVLAGQKHTRLKLAASETATRKSESLQEPVTESGIQTPQQLEVESTPNAENPIKNSFKVAQEIQTVLRRSGCYGGAIDGILGNQSLAALALFSEQAGNEVKVGRVPSLQDLDTALDQIRSNMPVQCPEKVGVSSKVVRTSQPRVSIPPVKECLLFNGESFCN